MSVSLAREVKRAFIDHDNDHVYSRIRHGTGEHSGVQSLHVEVVTADGKTLTPGQYRALQQRKKNGRQGCDHRAAVVM